MILWPKQNFILWSLPGEFPWQGSFCMVYFLYDDEVGRLAVRGSFQKVCRIR